MRLSCSEITTATSTFAEDVVAYQTVGLDAIGIWEHKLAADDGDNLMFLRDHGLAVANCVPTVSSILPLAIPGMEGPPDLGRRLRMLCDSIERLAAYEPESVIVLTGPAGALTRQQALDAVLDALPSLNAAARRAGVRLGLEPVHPSQRDEVSFVTSLRAADRLLVQAGTDAIGIHFDTYHQWDDADAPRWIAANAGRITGVHVSDWPRDRSSPDRVLPGEGGGRSRALVSALRTAGWSGSLDVEIFSSTDRFARPSTAVAREVRAAVQTLLC